MVKKLLYWLTGNSPQAKKTQKFLQEKAKPLFLYALANENKFETFRLWDFFPEHSSKGYGGLISRLKRDGWIIKTKEKSDIIKSSKIYQLLPAIVEPLKIFYSIKQKASSECGKQAKAIPAEIRKGAGIEADRPVIKKITRDWLDQINSEVKTEVKTDVETEPNLQELIQKAKRQKGSLSALARKLNVDESTLRKYLTGKRNLSQSTQERILKLLKKETL